VEASPGTTQSFKTGTPHPPPGWIADARAQVSGEADHLVWRDAEGTHVELIREGWTRLGRSLSAHVRFDDATVSRRHALLHRDEDGVRLLDDRSLNGVYVNGERVEWRELEDGDEVVIGRFRMWFLRGAGAAQATAGRGRQRALA
jgi:hypothetical protein